MSQVYLNKGYNTDGKAWSTPASVEGLEGLDTDSSTTLYDAVVECRVIKTKKEIDIMQHITNLSSEAHFEVKLDRDADENVQLRSGVVTRFRIVSTVERGEWWVHAEKAACLARRFQTSCLVRR